MTNKRYGSLDQFRGFAILAMVFVNVLGRFNVMPEIFRHARYQDFSIADAVAPFFFFIVGAGFRISYMKNLTKFGKKKTIFIAIKRYLILFVIGVFVYHFNTSRIFWDALTQISFAGLLALPVIGAKKIVRIITPFVYLAIFIFLKQIKIFPIDIEPLAWTLLVLMGSLIVDWLEQPNRNIIRNCLLYGLVLFTIGVMLAFFLGKAGAFAAYGLIYLSLSFLLFMFFYFIADIAQMPLPHLSTIGKNAIVVYILHYYIRNDLNKFVSDDAGFITAFTIFLIVYFGCYTVARYLEKRNYIITI